MVGAGDASAPPPPELAGRLFVAAWPDQAFHDAVRPLDRWLEGLAWIRAIPPASRHLTAAFLGETEAEDAAALLACLEEFSRSRPPIQTSASGLIALPDRRRPRVLALELQDDAGRLPTLLRELVEALALSAPTDELLRALERPPLAHVTVARARRGARANQDDLYQPPVVQAGFSLHSLALVRSTLTPAGPRYKTLRSVPLAGASPPPPV